MRRCTAFRPSIPDALESRVVLSHSGRGLSVVVSGLYPHQQVLSRRQQPVIGEVNQAFDAFVNDYDQARATYFASLQDPSAASSAAALAAFKSYTLQRVSLLSQQLISSFLQAPQATARAKGQPGLLKQLIELKIIGPPTKPLGPGSLASALTTTIPPAGSSAPTAALYSLSQDNAIESARAAVINGLHIAKNQDFGNTSQSHH